MSQASPNPFEPPGTYWRNEPDARSDGIQYLESYSYIFRSPDWVLNVLFTLICQFIPVIGPIVLLGYQFQIVEAMITNFHLPRSTLLALVGAFAGLERMFAAYRHAIGQRYRFYSYGDAMLIV